MFFSESTDRLRELFPAAVRREPPESLREFTIVTVDGKTMKRVARRLKPLRKVSGGVLGGKALVATEFRTGMALAMAVDPDGHANDVKLVPELLPEVRRRTESLCLWMADRQFCDLVQMERFTEKGDHFLVRYHAKPGFHPDPDRCECRRVDREGREYVEEWGWLGRENHKLRRYVRRVRRDVPDEETISVVTDLLDENIYLGEDLLAMYRERFGIERMFQKVVDVFGLESMIGGTPEATIFQFAFCLLLYNQIQVIRGYVAEQQKVEFETVSLEQFLSM